MIARIAAGALGTVVCLAACHRHAPERALPELHVPRATEPIKIDGDLDEPSWRASVRKIFLRPDGSEGRPYSDLRLTWSGTTLHVGLYASDHDIVTSRAGADGPLWRGDDFHLVFARGKTSYGFDVDPSCTITDGEREGNGAWNYAWQSGAKAACDADGTIDHPGDNDEEWVVEMDVPLAALGLSGKPGERIDLSARRCDVKEVGAKPLETPCPEMGAVVIVLD